MKCSDKGKELGNILSEGAQTDLEQRSHVLSHLQYLAPNLKIQHRIQNRELQISNKNSYDAPIKEVSLYNRWKPLQKSTVEYNEEMSRLWKNQPECIHLSQSFCICSSENIMA